MKTGKKIIIVGAVGVIGYLAYLYFKNQKKTTGESGGLKDSLPPFIQSLLPENTSESTTNTGTSSISPDPLSTSEQKIADAVVAEIQKTESVISPAQQKEADDYLLKLALLKETEAKAKALSQQIYDTRNKPAYTSEQINQKARDIARLTNQLKAMGYISTGAGTIKLI
jgi:hypothetical protein